MEPESSSKQTVIQIPSLGRTLRIHRVGPLMRMRRKNHVLPYVRHVSECIRRIMTPLNIRTCFKPHKTLRSLLVRAKDRTPTSAKSGIVYQVPCGSCSETYIGQSGRTLTHRLKNTRGLSLQQILPTTRQQLLNMQ